MIISRIYDKTIPACLQKGKVLALYGPRRVGKTTLLKSLLASFPSRYLFVTGEDMNVQNALSSQSVETVKSFFGGYNLIVIDEAQFVPNLGMGLKMLADSLPETQLIASGSFSYKIADEIGEPLTGRKKTLTMFPVSAGELVQQDGLLALKGRLPEFLIYGMYPEIVTAPSEQERRERLIELRNDYLFRDIIAFEGIRNSDRIRKLLTLIAFQPGKEVSLSELATNIGMLWENWLVSERLKRNTYGNRFVNSYFWRTYSQQEIDLVEEADGKLHAFEFKWGTKTTKAPKTWRDTYPEATYTVINRDNFHDFVL